METNKVKAMLSQKLDDNMNFAVNRTNSTWIGDNVNSVNNDYSMTGWSYWTDHYYPQVIRETYPVYFKEQAKDKGKQAFEIIKMMKDKRFVKLETVGEFIDLMDELIKII